MTLKQLNEKIEQMFDMKTTNKMISIRTIGERKYKEICYGNDHTYDTIGCYKRLNYNILEFEDIDID